jgi:hypothetical protein
MPPDLGICVLVEAPMQRLVNCTGRRDPRAENAAIRVDCVEGLTAALRRRRLLTARLP